MSAVKQREIFDAALDIADDAGRRALLDRVCAGDAQLRAEVDELLAAHAQSEKFFSNFATVVMESATAAFAESGQVAGVGEEENLVGSKIGPYTLLQKLGEGGCGAVFMAEQQSPVRRRVALKIIKLGMDTKSVIARFTVEQKALALMDHPNIARVLDAGATQTGRPFFVMELVHGVRITDYCDERGLNTRQRLKLFMQVCHAIQHAHQKGIIHRDIKPTNILVSEHDGVAVPKVIDFGIAKAMEQKLTEESAFTAQGLFIGTPAYMSPEQAQMSRLDVDTRSDVYSLGVLLYELLTGKTPFDQQELLAAGLDEMRRTILDKEPHRPSAKLDSLAPAELNLTAHRRHAEPSKLRSELAHDLDWIVMKALEKDRSRRYQTANGLALDVQRYLDNEAVFARPPSRLYRFQKLFRRNKVAFTAFGLVVAILIVGIIVSTRLWLKEREARRQVVAEQQQKLVFQQEAERLDGLRRAAEDGRKFAQATALFRQGKLDNADDLLDELSKYSVTPDDAAMYRQIGDRDAQQRRWAKALSRFTVLLQINQPTNGSGFLDDFRVAAVLVDQGEFIKYEEFGKSVITRYEGVTDPVMAARVLRLCLLSEANSEIITALKPFNNLAVSSLQTNANKLGGQLAWVAYSAGLMAYRSGDYASATNWCKLALNHQDLPIRDVCVRLVRAMTLAKLGQREEARAEVTAVRHAVESDLNEFAPRPKGWQGYWFDWAIIRILLREASQMDELADFPE